MRRVANGKLVFSYLLIALAAVLRLAVSAPLNVVPVFSCILLFGAARPRREAWIPLAALIGVDVYLTTRYYHYPVSIDQAVIWVWYAVVMLLGSATVRRTRAIGHGVWAALAASAGFFLISNFAVWASWNMYPRTLPGLAMCYGAALPFFRNNLISETVCSAVIFSVWKYYPALIPAGSHRGIASQPGEQF